MYYFIQHTPLQFKVTGIMTICWDVGELSHALELIPGVLCQRLYYGAEAPYQVHLDRGEV